MVNMMNKKSIIAIVIIIVIVICGAYYAFSGSDDGKVTIGYLPSDHDAALFVADADQDYKAKGIETELVQFNNGGDLMTALASGDVDIGYVGITPVLSSIEKGVPVKVVAGVQDGGSGLVVSEESGIHNVSDLKGKNIATPGEASIQYMLLDYYLNQNNLSTDDLNVSAMKVAPMNDALNSNKIDGMLTYEPYATSAVENGNILLVNSDSIIDNHPCCVVAASDDFIKNHPDQVKDIVSVHENATKEILDNRTGSVSKLPSDIVSNASVEEKAIGGIDFIYGLNDTYKQNIMDFMQIEVDLGMLKKPLTESQIFWDGK